jgi:hypothetical protein
MTVWSSSQSLHQSLERVSDVLEQAPPVGDLDGVRGTQRDAVGIGTRAVAADDLNARVRLELRGQSLNLAIRQEVNDRATFQINEDGAVSVAFTLGPVVHAEHAWCRRLRRSYLADAADERVGAGLHSQSQSEARGGFTPKCEANQREGATEPGRLSGVARHDRRQSLAEDPLLTQVMLAEEATGV